MKKFTLPAVVFALSSVLTTSIYAADRNPHCDMTLNYQQHALAGMTPACDWKTSDGPMEVKLTVINVPNNVAFLKVHVDCQVNGKLKGPLGGFAPAVQGKKSFSGNMSNTFPIDWLYQTKESHGNILVYVDDDQPTASIHCNGKFAE